MFLILLPLAVFILALAVLGLWTYQRQGIYGLVKLYLVLVGAMSALMWLTQRLSGEHGSATLDALLSLFPWGMIWVIDTVLLALFFAFTLKKQEAEAAP